ncbi:MAG: hypothetical protein V4732_10685 [Pseudomonadota bacterium]
MKIIKIVMVLAISSFSLHTFAQSVESQISRNANQQERIQSGLGSGALNVHEAAKLEKAEANIEHMQAKALQDGSLSTREANRIKSAQNKTSAAIYQQKHDAQTGNPDSVSAMRMQENVQQNINQQHRIEKGLSSGQLNNHEVAKLERGQAQASRREARAGADGHISAHEQNQVQHKQDKQSRKIHRQKHDRQTRS